MIRFKRHVAIIGLIFGPFVLVAVAIWGSYCATTGRKLTLYAIRRELSIGMSRPEADSVIERHAARYLVREWSQREEQLSLLVMYGIGQESCSLTLRFRSGKLESARIRGEDGEHDRCGGDGPPDLG